MRPISFVVLLPFLLAGCAAPPRTPDVRVCDGAGCRQQERSTEVAQPSQSPRETYADPRMEAIAVRAEAGDVAAAQDLGLAHLTGTGAPQNGGLAMRWLRRAAEGGDAEAQLTLGRLYLTGYETVGQDVTEAERWLRAAAGAGGKQEKIAKEAQRLLVEVEREKAKKPDWATLMAERRAATAAWLRELATARLGYSYNYGRGGYDPRYGRYPRRY